MRIRYEKPPLGVGGFGRVYKAHVVGDWEGSRAIALKKVRNSDYVRFPCLLHEACGLVLAKDHPSIPQVFGWGRSQFYEYLAIELLDCDLTAWFRHRPLTRRNFVSLVLQMFAAVKHVHASGVLHCDIKPENFMFGRGENAGRVYLIDFNLWTAWRSFDTREHFVDSGECVNLDAAAGFRGTLRYASINCHLDGPLSRRDDLESLAYTIFALYAAELPWSHMNEMEWHEIVGCKQLLQTSRSLQGTCEYPLGDLVYYAQDLDFPAEPDYDRWREAFWRVDNAAADFPDCDPLYDPADTTEEVPRNMDFVDWEAADRSIHSSFRLPFVTNGGRMQPAPGSDHGYRPASSEWGHPLTMVSEDTVECGQDLIRDFVQPISQPPTTTYPSLASLCAPEAMRAFDDPIPFNILYIDFPESEDEAEGAEEQLDGETVEEMETEGNMGGGEDSGGVVVRETGGA